MQGRAGTLVAAAVGVVALAAMALTAPSGAPDADRGGSADAAGVRADTVDLVPTTEVTPETDGIVTTERSERARATFAGGCFWCMEPPYDELEGVVSTTSGYAGGHVENPSYEEVSSGGTGHREAMQVVYDPSVVSYAKLLEVFWHNVDPTDDGGQFCDRGYQYTTAIFYHNEEQRELAEASKERLVESGALSGEIVTPVEPLNAFYAAEDYHQDYYREHSLRYKFYRWNCGRDERLRELWGESAVH
jgi:peptide-methionine (S)-S-oxide reductase